VFEALGEVQSVIFPARKDVWVRAHFQLYTQRWRHLFHRHLFPRLLACGAALLRTTRIPIRGQLLCACILLQAQGEIQLPLLSRLGSRLVWPPALDSPLKTHAHVNKRVLLHSHLLALGTGDRVAEYAEERLVVNTLAAFRVDRHLASASVVESIDKELEVFMRVLLFMPCEILGQPVSAKPSKKSLD